MNYLGKDVQLKVVGTRPVRPDGVDKVIGRAAFGADFAVAGMIHGAVVRSPHAHARIKSIDTSKAEALKGVKAVITAKDLPEIPSEEAFVGEGPVNFRDVSMNTLAREKVLYDGHAVAAVAATTLPHSGPRASPSCMQLCTSENASERRDGSIRRLTDA